MLERFRRKRQNRAVVDGLWEQIVERARTAERFEEGGLPDTVLGRFESLGMEVFLFMRRCARDAELHGLSQDVVDRFMTDLDHSMRELGVGYLAVPKRMRLLAGRFYERARVFETPVETGDTATLANEIRRLVHRDAPGGDPDRAAALAAMLVRDASFYGRRSADDLLSGRLAATSQSVMP